MCFIPQSLLARLGPGKQCFTQIRAVHIPAFSLSLLEAEHYLQLASKHIADARYERANSGGKETHGSISLFRHIFDSDMPESELSTNRLQKEAQVMLGAGTVSTGRTMEFILYYILANNHIQSMLRKELRDSMADYPEKMPSWADLEKLPYLQAIIKEGLRSVLPYLP